MSAKNKFVTLGVACASLAMVAFAQDDLDNLLEALDTKKPSPQAEAPAKPSPAAAAPAEEKPAEPAPKVEAPAPAPKALRVTHGMPA